ncbi:MAG: Flp pilus assembly complex ATPase component TadA [Nanoarchaeota archaeon]|nr:Flp pilus assembly complex ATPase component TadA [Nanoarchaeota archaeon]MBU4352270.1 Flp pilus assembly complex ATPase component TadA [Nanoarchaeota archaeon]MBU4456026.1 Flp pilus assembly complex ATPase component TadA [Nanoarchaeota archaeon]MCG2719536.1 Flp pilus assembly complex ATPase component TadA [Nanoarchaeota archaeon]
MADGKKLKPGGYELVKEGIEDIMRINYENIPYPPSIEGNAFVMADAIDKLNENPSVGRIVFMQRRFFEYNYEQTQMLVEIANIYSYLIKAKKVLSPEAMGTSFESPGILAERYALIRNLVFDLLKSDPLGAYVELKRTLRFENAKLKETVDKRLKESKLVFMNLLLEIHDLLDKTKLIKLAKQYLPGYVIGDRSIYPLFFKPVISPDFMFTKIMASPPLDGEALDIYTIDKNTEVTIYRTPKDIKYIYHLMPPEFKLTEDKYTLVDLAKAVLSEHKPREESFLDPQKLRATFSNIGRDLIRELADHQGVDLKVNEIKELTEILLRHTIGFGFIELLLKDPKIQDVNINSPNGQVPIFVLHADYDNCTTNLIPSMGDTESWASKFRLLSGRPLDEANPILDTELTLPDSRSRVSMITKPLNPYGLAFSFRRHRDTPWTLPLFMKNKMINPLAAGLISFLVDGTRTLLVAGTRSSGKTSLLGACMVEIMRKCRILTIEDSVTGDTSILIRRNGIIERTTVGKLIDEQIEKYGCWYELSDREVLGNEDNIEVISMTKDGKMEFKKPSKFVKHKVNKPIYEITTCTGRKIKVTGDHSLFGLGQNAKIEPLKVSKIKEGSFIAVPRCLPIFNSNWNEIYNFKSLIKLNKAYFQGEPIKVLLKEHKFEVKQLGLEHGYKKCQIIKWFKLGLIPGKILNDLECFGFKFPSLDGIKFKISGNSKWLDASIILDEEFITFIGLWIADGCYDKNSVIICASSDEEKQLVKKIAKKFNLEIKFHSDKFSQMLNSKTLKVFMREILNLKGNAYTKRVPDWIFGLSNIHKAAFLRGMFSGDGCAAKTEICIPLCSYGLLQDLQTLLLSFGIILRIGKIRKDKTFNASISSLKFWIIFKKYIGFLQKNKNLKLNLLCKKISTHDTSDIIPLIKEDKIRFAEICPEFRIKRYYIHSNNNVGMAKMQSLTQIVTIQDDLINNLKTLACSDVYFDKVRSVKEVFLDDVDVYDFSVPETENFVCENIVAHNTLELPTSHLRRLGYDTQQIKVRAALMEGGTEMSAAEGIRTSLRMGDSALIVGEVRSKEAIALYEAMRIGAMANTVAGTIHGDSPYGVFDRVVNDLGVPKTSFKATDIIIIANPLKSPDGLHKWRRVTQITEVRKEWEDDPIREHGFVDLMKYNAQTDELEPTPELINGDSEVLKAIGANIKEWAGDWDAIWDNIQLRADTKKMLLEYSVRLKSPNLLEADFVIWANDEFHRISNRVKEEEGFIDSAKILFEWEEWLKKVIRREEVPK